MRSLITVNIAHFSKLYLVFAPALQIVVYGSNWNGEKWDPIEGVGDDSIIGMLNGWNPNAAFALKVIFWISG